MSWYEYNTMQYNENMKYLIFTAICNYLLRKQYYTEQKHIKASKTYLHYL